MNKRTLSLLFALIALACIAGGIAAGMHRSREPAPPPTPAPEGSRTLLDRSFPDAAGKIQPLAQWRGKILIVNFWAPWCAPCVKEMPELAALQNAVDPARIRVLGIGLDSAVNISAFSAKHGIGYPLYVAGYEGIALSRELGNQAGGLPFTVLIGADGNVRKTYLGVRMDELRQDLAAL